MSSNKRLPHWRQELEDLKDESTRGPRVENNEVEDYRIRIVRRGEGIFYQEGTRALICVTDPFEPIVVLASISKWDDGAVVTNEERETIMVRLKNYFKTHQGGVDLKII